MKHLSYYILKFKNINLHKNVIQSGFTLLELIIVIGILGILSVSLVIVLNPAEVIKKSRDTQRISDLNTIKRAIGVYQINNPNPKMAGANNTGCKGTTSSDSFYQTASDHIYYSYPSDIATITATQLDGVTFSAGGAAQVTKANMGKVDGTGWLPIDFATLSGGSPISNLPIDPVNKIADITKPTLTDLVYRYVCSEKTFMYEIDAVLESTAYTITDLKMANDGGNNDSYYEVGTDLNLFNMESPLVAGTYTIVGRDHLLYKTVIAEDGKEWLDRNLGATRVATTYNDTQSYGDLYQWGRGVDGHQITTSGTTTTRSISDSPGHSNFIISTTDWRNPPNNSLWQGINGINNPCPSGFRIPTQPEWATILTSSGITDGTTAFNSILKLSVAGFRYNVDGVVYPGSSTYWSSSLNGTSSYDLYIAGSSATSWDSDADNHSNGYSVRCIKN